MGTDRRAAVVQVMRVMAALFAAPLALAGPALVASRLVLGPDPEPGALEALSTPAYLSLLVLPSQLALVALALVASTRDRAPLTERLGLVRPALSGPAIVLCLLATHLVGVLGFVILALAGGPNEHLRQMTEAVTPETLSEAIFTAGFVGLVPGFCEELFFRGYAQRSLARVTPSILAVVVTGSVFALVHGDWLHALTILPLSLWFGALTVASRSVIPAMLAHTLWNGLGIVAAYAGEVFMPILVALLLLSIPAFAVACRVLWRTAHGRARATRP